MKLKKYLASALCIALIASMGISAYADEQEGTAELELTTGQLTLVTDPAKIAELPADYHNISSLSVDFGEHTVSGIATTYETEDQKPVGIIVQDARGLGELSTWNVTAKLGEFKSGGATTLAGSQLNFLPTEVIVPGTAPSGSQLPTPEEVHLAPGAVSGTRIFVADNGGSAGTWGTEWVATLDVPASAEVGEHTATLVWTLSDGI